MSGSNFIHHLFVYGSLRRGFQSDAYSYLTDFFDYVGDGIVQGHLHDNGVYPVAVPGNDDHIIVGELYRLRHESEYNYAMMQLDDYEGVGVEEGQTPLYRRESVLVLINGNPVEAWIYWFNGDISGMPLLDETDLLKYFEKKNH